MRFLIPFLLLSLTISAQKPQAVSSPNGKLIWSFHMKGDAIIYNVSFNGKTVIANSLLTLRFDDGYLHDLRLGRIQRRDTTEEYDLFVGKASHIITHYKEIRIPLLEKSKKLRSMNLVVRAFDDGIAFRYEFPLQANWSSYVLEDETSTFTLPGNPKLRALLLPSYTSSHEGFYTKMALNDIREDTLMDMPVLVEFPGPIFLSITEAQLTDYAGMYLMRKGNTLVSKLSPLPGQKSVKVKATMPHRSPWRVMMIGDRIGALIESNILTSLNEPSKIQDLSWLKPGKTTFPWWNGNVVPDSNFAPGNNFETNKYYIDFCARNNIQYHSVVEYGLHQWYMDDGVGFQPGPHADVTTPVPGLDMKQICDYGKEKGVGIRVWVHWAALYPKLDSAFAIFERWGLQGMMVDFMDRDDQEMVRIQEEMLQKAAKHHLHIQFHGAYKPTGMHRTYPNELTREGTLNYETNKWNETALPPSHDLDIIFTRMLAGSSDYHLGGFRAVPAAKYKTQYTRPLMAGTRCHMLGMYVVLESYLGMVCDYPEAYEGQSGFEFLQQVPSTWDETVVPAAEIDGYVAIARRKGQEWWVGVIGNDQAREVIVPLAFLKNGKYEAVIYTDKMGADPNQLQREARVVDSKEKLIISLAPGGGAAVHLRKK